MQIRSVSQKWFREGSLKQEREGKEGVDRKEWRVPFPFHEHPTGPSVPAASIYCMSTTCPALCQAQGSCSSQPPGLTGEKAL